MGTLGPEGSRCSNGRVGSRETGGDSDIIPEGYVPEGVETTLHPADACSRVPHSSHFRSMSPHRTWLTSTRTRRKSARFSGENRARSRPTSPVKGWCRSRGRGWSKVRSAALHPASWRERARHDRRASMTPRELGVASDGSSRYGVRECASTPPTRLRRREICAGAGARAIGARRRA